MTEKVPLRGAIIGAGAISRQHAAAVSQSDHGEVVVVCDRSPVTAECAAERFGLNAWYSDHRKMLEDIQPDVVHVTTPPGSHFAIAMDAIAAGAHVIVEKPLTVEPAQRKVLLDAAAKADRRLVEDFNYLFNDPVVELRRMLSAGELGEIVHCEIGFALDILGADSRYTDPNLPHPFLNLPGGVIGDFLPHLAYLAHCFVGACHSSKVSYTKRFQNSPLPSDEFRALLEGETGTAHLMFTAHSQPDAFWVRVLGTKARAEAQIFDPRVLVERSDDSAGPLLGLFNGRRVAKAARRAAFGGLWSKLARADGSYEGLWRLIGEVYRALAEDEPMPVTPRMIHEVGEMIDGLAPCRELT